MSNRILSPSHNAPAHDLVATPQSLANLIVSYFNPSGRLLDPSAGDVTKPFFTAMLQPGIAAEYVDWCEIGVGLDFFDYPARVDWIITNPPWSKFRRFLLKGYEVADHVVYLGTLTHFVTRARLEDARRAGFGLVTALLVHQPPPPWPSSGFQLAAVHLSRGWTGPLTIDDHLVR